MLQPLLFTALCEAFSLLEKRYHLLLLSGMRSYMHAIWIALEQKPRTPTCCCLLMKRRRTGARLVAQVADHSGDNVAMYFVCGVRYSILPAITLDGIITYDIIEGPVDSACFLCFLQEHVVSLMHFKLIKMADLFRCLSLPHILDRAVSLSWTIVVFTKVKKFVQTCTVRCYIY